MLGDLFYEFINTVHLNKIRAKPDTIGEIKPPSTFGVSSVAPFGGPSIIHSKRETQSNEHNDTHDNNDNSNEEQLVIQDARINEQLNSTNLDDGFGEDAEDNFF